MEGEEALKDLLREGRCGGDEKVLGCLGISEEKICSEKGFERRGRKAGRGRKGRKGQVRGETGTHGMTGGERENAWDDQRVM